MLLSRVVGVPGILGGLLFGGTRRHVLGDYQTHGFQGNDLGVFGLKHLVQRMFVKAVLFGSPRELAEPIDQLFVELIGELGLGTEEDNASLSNYGNTTSAAIFLSDMRFQSPSRQNVLMMPRSRMSSSELGALSQSARLTLANSVPMQGVQRVGLNLSRHPESSRGLGYVSAMLLVFLSGLVMNSW